MNKLSKCHSNATPNSSSSKKFSPSTRKRAPGNGSQKFGLVFTPQYDPGNVFHTPDISAASFLDQLRSLQSAQPDLQISSFVKNRLERTIISDTTPAQAVEIPRSSYNDLRLPSTLTTVDSDTLASAPSSPTPASKSRVPLYRPPSSSRSLKSNKRNVPTELFGLVRELCKQDSKGDMRKLLRNYCPTSEQELLDFLSDNGFATPDVLVKFRFSEVYSLCLSKSLDRDPLDLIGFPYSNAFGCQDAFPYLTNLDMTAVHLADEDVKFFASLPRLEVLVLEATGIGDEGVMYLVGLKGTIRHLNIAGNVSITDESMTCLVKLGLLEFVALHDTSTTMAGLRKLATAFKGRIEVSLPRSCLAYLKSLSAQTFTKGSRPGAVRDLTVVELRKRLQDLTGESVYASKKHLREKLEAALKRRSGDC